MRAIVRSAVFAALFATMAQADPPAALPGVVEAEGEEFDYDPSDDELDAVIDEAVGEEPGLEGAVASDPTAPVEEDVTEPEVVDEPELPAEPAASTNELDGVFTDPQAMLRQDRAGPPLFMLATLDARTMSMAPPTQARFVRAAFAAQTSSAQSEGDTYVDLSSPELRCDAIGADPLDPDRLITADGRVDGVPDETLDLRDILQECGSGITRAEVGNERAKRRAYIRARALSVMRRWDEAKPQFDILCDADYGIACYQLALYYSVPRGTAPANQSRARQYAEKAARLYVAVAGPLAERFEADDWVGRTNVPGFHRAMLDGDFSAIPQTLSMQRVVITIYGRLQQRGQMWTEAPFSVADQRNALKLKVPLLAGRMRAGWDQVPAVFQAAPRGPGLEAWLENALRTGADIFGIGRTVGALEVSVAASDAKTISSDFEARPNSGDRQRYLATFSKLLAAWAQRDPAPDSDRVCALFKEGMRAGCLPLEDYNADAPSIS